MRQAVRLTEDTGAKRYRDVDDVDALFSVKCFPKTPLMILAATTYDVYRIVTSNLMRHVRGSASKNPDAVLIGSVHHARILAIVDHCDVNANNTSGRAMQASDVNGDDDADDVLRDADADAADAADADGAEHSAAPRAVQLGDRIRAELERRGVHIQPPIKPSSGWILSADQRPIPLDILQASLLAAGVSLVLVTGHGLKMTTDVFNSYFPKQGWQSSRHLPSFITCATVSHHWDRPLGLYWNPAVVNDVHKKQVTYRDADGDVAVVRVHPLGFDSPATVLVHGGGAKVRTGDVSLHFAYADGVLDDAEAHDWPIPLRCYLYTSLKHAIRTRMGPRARRSRVVDTVAGGRKQLDAFVDVGQYMIDHAGQLHGLRTEVSYVCVTPAAMQKVLSAGNDLESWKAVARTWKLPTDLILGLLIDLEVHGHYILELVQRAQAPELFMFRTANDRPQAPTDLLRKQDMGKLSDMENATTIDTAKTNVALFCEKNWSTTFYNNFDFDGSTGPAITQPGADDARRALWEEFDAKARLHLDALQLQVYSAMSHYRHPTSGFFGAQMRRGGVMLDGTSIKGGGGCLLPCFATPLDTARYWTMVLGPLNDQRWAKRPLMLKQDKKEYTGARVAVAGVILS